MTNREPQINQEQKTEERELHDQKVFSHYSEIREKNKFAVFYQEARMKKMSALIDFTPQRLLDYCCGTGIFFPYLKTGVKYFGVDLSESMLAAGRLKYGQNENFLVFNQDAENLSFESDFFEAVVAKGAIHHLTSPARGLKEIKRVLKPGGVLIITEPVSNALIKAWRRIIYKTNANFSSAHRSFTKKELIKLLQAENFEVLSLERYGLLSHIFAFPDIIPFLKYVPFWPVWLLFYLDKILLKIPIINSFSFSLIIKAKNRK